MHAPRELYLHILIISQRCRILPDYTERPGRQQRTFSPPSAFGAQGAASAAAPVFEPSPALGEEKLPPRRAYGTATRTCCSCVECTLCTRRRIPGSTHSAMEAHPRKRPGMFWHLRALYTPTSALEIFLVGPGIFYCCLHSLRPCTATRCRLLSHVREVLCIDTSCAVFPLLAFLAG